MSRRENRHASRLYSAWQTHAVPGTMHTKARGLTRQKDRRETERTVRREAVCFARWLRRCGRSRSEAAASIGLSRDTLGAWDRNWQTDRLALQCRGRPAARCSRAEREDIWQCIHRLGPYTGVEPLQGLYPDVARRELEHILYDYRLTHVRDNTILTHTVRWAHPGTVWTMDFTEPPAPVDRIYPYILVVRDMASGGMLMSLPVAGATGKAVRNALESLFKEHGAPLVVKCDNDSAFKSEHVRKLFGSYQVNFLLSPAGYPCYNGTCEAGIGALKTRAHHEAARHDRPGEWTCDDVEAARILSNKTSRPRGHKGPTPEEAWNRRERVSPLLRRSFARTLERAREYVMKREGYDEGAALAVHEQERIERKAVERALGEHGFFVTRRRRIYPPIFKRLGAKIS